MIDFTVPNQVKSLRFLEDFMSADKNPFHVLCYGMKVIWSCLFCFSYVFFCQGFLTGLPCVPQWPYSVKCLLTPSRQVSYFYNEKKGEIFKTKKLTLTLLDSLVFGPINSSLLKLSSRASLLHSQHLSPFLSCANNSPVLVSQSSTNTEAWRRKT